jgi:hypothetical protein
MKKYIQYLLSDIEVLIEQAPPPLFERNLHDDIEEKQFGIPFKHIKVAELIGLKTEIFPPEHFLSDIQVIILVEAINDLWIAWRLHSYIPHNVPFRTSYTAMVEAMDTTVAYDLSDGAEVNICGILAGEPCKFDGCGDNCFCNKDVKTQNQELLLWEEYMRSQGLDPDIDITPEEEALFEANMKDRRMAKDIENSPFFHSLFSEEEQISILETFEMIDDLIAEMLDDSETEFPFDDDELDNPELPLF